jgi:hypothetical protein
MSLHAMPAASIQQLISPDMEAAAQVAFELFAMHYVEVRRAYDFKNPGSQDQDPIFKNYSLPKHEVGYPGGIFAPFIPGTSSWGPGRQCKAMRYMSACTMHCAYGQSNMRSLYQVHVRLGSGLRKFCGGLDCR